MSEILTSTANYKMNSSSVHDCNIFEFERIKKRSGNITILENMNTCPFEINRVYYLYDIPGGESRGGHAHKELYQMIFAASGSFDIVLDDGKNKKTVTLNRPYYGLYVVPGIWRELASFSSGAICLVLASEKYDENDYIRNYKEFLELKNR